MTTTRCERCNGWSVTHPTQLALLTMWRALAARQGRLPRGDERSSLQAEHLNTVQRVNTARQAADVPPWQRAPRVAAVLMPRGSGRQYEMLWRG